MHFWFIHSHGLKACNVLGFASEVSVPKIAAVLTAQGHKGKYLYTVWEAIQQVLPSCDFSRKEKFQAAVKDSLMGVVNSWY